MADEPWDGNLWAAADLVTPMAIRVAATLKLADHIALGARTADALAEVVGAEPDALRRLLDHLVTAQVLTAHQAIADPTTEDRAPGEYRLTALGERLRDDHPDGMRGWLDIEGSVGRAELSFVQLLHTVRTGEAAFPHLYGRGFWEDLAADPKRSASFDVLMASRLTDAPQVAAAYPWGSLGHLVDVGGGNGSLLLTILQAHPELRGTVLDLAGPVTRAAEAIAAAGLDDRAGIHEGSFFDELPAGAGGYLLSGVLHDWPDDEAGRILRRCAGAAGRTGKVLIVEDNPPQTSGDLRMLCYVRGRDRTVGELTALAGTAGLEPGPVAEAGGRLIAEFHRHA
ncbi:methyltransferase [Actinoplanes sp. NBRC 103695]|uniref:methyltransferase n=1 Tax=Actinoplanes sp. NBRC 103695 TaxID=3032202 RepID=UPI0024A5C38D|nr:methyltransferase [Actinoplanes sp. NBRC 103695]GLY95202.1 methyltransferase [Actinoplanes sp. NBRC 103695]